MHEDPAPAEDFIDMMTSCELETSSISEHSTSPICVMGVIVWIIKISLGRPECLKEVKAPILTRRRPCDSGLSDSAWPRGRDGRYHTNSDMISNAERFFIMLLSSFVSSVKPRCMPRPSSSGTGALSSHFLLTSPSDQHHLAAATSFKPLQPPLVVLPFTVAG